MYEIITEFYKIKSRDNFDKTINQAENEEFIDKFSFKIKIFDPLDRDIMDNDGKCISILSKDFKNFIK